MAEGDARRVDWPDEPGIFDLTPEEERRRDEHALAEVRAGRYISNEAVMRWLASWGTDNPLPRPQVGD
ncbi:MAG: hypothetical protein AVDCRST_MAG91-1615 [uncultured Sphingomonadaceae bacterium]|uniref:CopG family transcriptional regulator n=1 Tax=uncultured Sphingomonadaceae bacterium TaxID=169976 RepID=A0A6J4T0P9_9SPHN|nr:MAG: hypothetical protein AVDCRST_MAG91-1615 [uncultured Sphingomonadaceae bacterium]